jgi:glutamine amidotransferase PdxT
VCPAIGQQTFSGGFVHFYSSHLVRISRALIAPAVLLALIITTGCGSSNWSAPQAAPSVADVAARAITGSSVPTVLLFVGTGTSSGAVAATKTILSNLKLTYATATSSQLNAMSESAMKAYKLFVMPGGNAITISKSLSSSTTTNLHNAIVNDGLHYFGICAGAFFAGSSGVYKYLNLTPSGVWFNYYADEFKGIYKEAVKIKGADGVTLDQYWENGPQLSGWGQVVGKYPDGTPAITEGKSGNGWVILSAVHPEAPDSWRSGMHFTTSAAVDNAYAQTLVTAALNGTSLVHF